jgi:plasmid stabilization system protein ParE
MARAAESDLAEIWAFIAKDDPEQATTFVLELEDRLQTLERSPERCPLISENVRLGASYRHLLHGAYRVIFRISGKIVIVLRILHGSRLLDPSALEFE